MEIDKVFSNDVDGVADNLFSAVKNSVSEIKAMQQRKAAENVQLVIQALKKIESDLQDKFDGVTTVIDKRVSSIKDGRDGLDGRNGRDGKDGRPGRDGAPGARGAMGVPGTNGRDGEDGVSVTDARIDFDGSLIISLSSGREINVGEVVAPDLAEKIKVITNGGGTSQGVLDTLASLQAQITAISSLGAVNYRGTWNASTNNPTITGGSGTKGYYYVVSVAGSTSIDGQTLWGVGDWIIFNGTAWQKVDGGSTGDFTNLSASGSVTLSGGTANGVAYLNGSKVLTTGSALTYNGTTLTADTASTSAANFRIENGSFNRAGAFQLTANGVQFDAFDQSSTSTQRSFMWLSGGSEQMRLTSTGLGIGTSSPSYKLDVNGDINIGASQYFRSGSNPLVASNSSTMNYHYTGTTALAWRNQNNTAEIMRLENSGNLGIGTSSPANKLSVVGTGTTALSFIQNSSSFAGGTNFTQPHLSINSGNDTTGNVTRLSMSVGTGAQVYLDALMESGVNVYSSLLFRTRGADGVGERMRLDSSGNLGIGTSSPNAKLVVAGGQQYITNVSAQAAGIEFAGNANTPTTTSLFVGQGSDSNGFLYQRANAPLIFGTNSTERARITSGGEVYIAGTTDQGAYNLQVNGTGVWGAGAYVNGSDRNLKDNIQSLDSCLDVVMAMRPVTFQYKPEHSKDQSVQPGFIAQELQEAMAGKAYIDGVVQAGPEYLNVAYQNIIPILVKAIQELKAEVAALKGNQP